MSSATPADVLARTITTTGRPFTATSLQVLRIREDEIVLFRDFADPRLMEDVTGEPPPGG